MKISRALTTIIALALILAPLAALAQARPSGAYVNVQIAAEADKYTGASLTTAGNGIFLTFISVDDNTAEYSLRITDADSPILSEDIATITPTFIYGPGPLVTVVKEGRSAIAFVEGDFLVLEHVHYQATSSNPIYVPPEKVVTIQRDTVNTALNVTLGFMELVR
jgi:hypothetical protein